MEAMNVLDKVTTAIEGVLKGAASVTKTERMTSAELLAYAIAQIEKAAKEPPATAERRLRALGRTVHAAKQAFVDTESEAIEVEVFEEETTASADESERETSLVAADAALGNTAFAANAEDLSKALSRLGKELEALRSGDPKTSAAPSEAPVEKREDVDWPFDMNTREFRDGLKKTVEPPAWGEDPKELRTTEA